MINWNICHSIGLIPARQGQTPKVEKPTHADTKAEVENYVYANLHCTTTVGQYFGSERKGAKFNDTTRLDSEESEQKSDSGGMARDTINDSIRDSERRSNHDAQMSVDDDSEESVRTKVIDIIQSMIQAGCEFEDDLISLIRAKIDPDESLLQRFKIILKILKTKHRKAIRKDKNKAINKKDAFLNLNSNLSETNLKNYCSCREIDCNGHLESKIEKTLQKLIIVDRQVNIMSKPGERLLSLINPQSKGLYWINHVKIPEIKSIWRRRLTIAQKEQKPEEWPSIVPENYRLNMNKRPLISVRGRLESRNRYPL